MRYLVSILGKHRIPRPNTPTYLQLGAARHHLLETNANTFYDGQKNRAADGAVPRRLVAASDGECAARQESGDDGIVGVFLSSNTLDSAIEGGEETAEDAKVAAEDRCPHLDRRECADAPLPVGRVSEPLDAMPDGPSDGLLWSAPS